MAAAEIFNKIYMYFAITLLFVNFCCCTFENVEQDLLQVNEFDVKPGGTTHMFEKTWEGVTCKFSYACQGGTHEKWVLGMTKSKDGSEITCSAERPDGISYLFFQQFEMYISHSYIRKAQVFGSQDSPLKSSEYMISKDRSLVKQVDGEFQSHLAKVEVYATSGKEEL